MGSLEAALRTMLVAILRSAAKRLHPAVLHEMLLGVGVGLGRQAAAEYRLKRHLIGRMDSRACATCLEAVGKELGWEFRASVESDSVIRIAVQDCPFMKLGRPDPYVTVLSYGILGGIAADEFGSAKVCAIHHPEMPPFHRNVTLYLQDTAESRATSGIVFPLQADKAVDLVKERSVGDLREHLTPRETEVFQLITQGLSDKEVAAKLRLSVRTVQNYAAQIRHKLGVRSRTALVRLALRAPVRNFSEM